MNRDQMKVHLQESEPGYRIFLYVFYACAFIMASVAFLGIYSMNQEWSTKGTYVMGEVLVKTEFPTSHFPKVLTWLYVSSLIRPYCVSLIGCITSVKRSACTLTVVQ